MLNGLDPIIIFNFYKNANVERTFQNLPFEFLVGSFSRFALPPIPIYLSEELTGLYIESESKNIDIETVTDSLSSGNTPLTTQRPLNASVKVNFAATRDSLGLILLSAMADLVLPKLTSQEYSIVYLHGATTIFNGQLHSFAIDEDSNSTLVKLSIELITAKNAAGTTVPKPDNPADLNNTGEAPTQSLPQPGGGSSAPTPVPPQPSIPIGRAGL